MIRDALEALLNRRARERVVAAMVAAAKALAADPDARAIAMADQPRALDRART